MDTTTYELLLPLGIENKMLPNYSWMNAKGLWDNEGRPRVC